MVTVIAAVAATAVLILIHILIATPTVTVAASVQYSTARPTAATVRLYSAQRPGDLPG